MTPDTTSRTQPSSDPAGTMSAVESVIAMVSAALREGDALGPSLDRSLRRLAGSINAFGCILWQELSPDRPLSVFAQSFTPEVTPYRLDVTDAITKRARTTGKTQVADFQKLSRERTRFAEVHGILFTCAVPLRYEDGSVGALTLYRQGLQGEFSIADVKLAEQLAGVLPMLIQAVFDQSAIALLESLNQLLHQAEVVRVKAASRKLEVTQLADLLNGLGEALAKSLQCREVSIFLEVLNRGVGTGRFRRFASWGTAGTGNEDFTQDDPSVLGYVVRSHGSVWIHDLLDATAESVAELNRIYPDISIDSLVRMRKELIEIGLGSDRDGPPVGALFAPIEASGEVMGVIRCRAPAQAPFGFSLAQQRLLERAATQIALTWSIWRTRLMTETAPREIDTLNLAAEAVLTGPHPDPEKLYSTALELLRDVTGAEILSIRVPDETGKALRFAKWLGDAWEEGGADKLAKRLALRFPLDGRSAGAMAMKHARTVDVDRPEVAENYHPTFPQTKRLIVAPIRFGTKTLGVLDVRATTKSPLRVNARLLADLFGQQLGLYLVLVDTIRREIRFQAQTFTDLRHQLKSPLLQASLRIEKALDHVPRSDDGTLSTRLQEIRGLTTKTRRVALNIGLFAALARGEQIPVAMASLQQQKLVQFLIATASDTALVYRRGLNCRVLPPSFELLQRMNVRADFGLLEQALITVLDNAGKYSFRGTQIVIQGGITDHDEFQIIVDNVGIRLESEHVGRAVQRGWRSRNASIVTGEGSGIGLWIVDHIMKAQGGRLVLKPTDERGHTEVSLVLPNER